jgi:hypothetical protein
MQKQEDASYARQQEMLLCATARMRGAELLLALLRSFDKSGNEDTIVCR